jgi:hypothetical protein
VKKQEIEGKIRRQNRNAAKIKGLADAKQAQIRRYKEEKAKPLVPSYLSLLLSHLCLLASIYACLYS